MSVKKQRFHHIAYDTQTNFKIKSFCPFQGRLCQIQIRGAPFDYFTPLGVFWVKLTATGARTKFGFWSFLLRNVCLNEKKIDS